MHKRTSSARSHEHSNHSHRQSRQGQGPLLLDRHRNLHDGGTRRGSVGGRIRATWRRRGCGDWRTHPLRPCCLCGIGRTRFNKSRASRLRAWKREAGIFRTRRQLFALRDTSQQLGLCLRASTQSTGCPTSTQQYPATGAQNVPASQYPKSVAQHPCPRC